LRRARVSTVSFLLALFLAVPGSAQGHHARQALLDKVNQARAQAGLNPLRTSSSLSASSSSFSRSLLGSGGFGHGPRVSASRRFKGLAEAMSLHPGSKPSPGSVVRRWLSSPGHRAVLLKRGVNYVGAGYASGRFRGRGATIWVLQVGRL
jgi:uncharacterized protein YkwD